MLLVGAGRYRHAGCSKHGYKLDLYGLTLIYILGNLKVHSFEDLGGGVRIRHGTGAAVYAVRRG